MAANGDGAAVVIGEKPIDNIWCKARQILMNNPRVHSQTAQNLDVKKGLIRHHQRLEITMTQEAFHHENLTLQLCNISAIIHIFAFLQFKVCNLAFG